MIDASFVKAIQDNAKTDAIVIDGRQYATKPVFLPPPPAEPQPETLTLHTLSSLKDYVSDGIVRDGVEAEELIVHIASPWLVRVLSDLQGFHRRRDCYVQAECDAKFKFDEFLPHAQFMIGLQTHFQDYGDRGRLLQAIGTIRDENVKTSRDDGFTQLATVASGIALNAEIALPNPVTLRPFRTFREVPQPPGSFILRLQPSGKGLPLVALFEADGGQWMTEAVASIYEFLQKLTASGVVILR